MPVQDRKLRQLAPASNPAVLTIQRSLRTTNSTYATPAQLESWKDDIIKWYIKEHRTLKYILNCMEEKGVRATPKQIKAKISQWGVRKNRNLKVVARNSAASISQARDNNLWLCALNYPLVGSDESIVKIYTRLVWDIRNSVHDKQLHSIDCTSVIIHLAFYAQKAVSEHDPNTVSTPACHQGVFKKFTTSMTSLGGESYIRPFVSFALIALIPHITDFEMTSLLPIISGSREILMHFPMLQRAYICLRSLHISSGKDFKAFLASLSSILSEIPACIRVACGDGHWLTSLLLALLDLPGSAYYLSVMPIPTRLASREEFLRYCMLHFLQFSREDLPPMYWRYILRLAELLHDAVFVYHHGPWDYRIWRSSACSSLAHAHRRFLVKGVPGTWHATSTGLLEEAIGWKLLWRNPKISDLISMLRKLRSWYQEVGDEEKAMEVTQRIKAMVESPEDEEGSDSWVEEGAQSPCS